MSHGPPRLPTSLGLWITGMMSYGSGVRNPEEDCHTFPNGTSGPLHAKQVQQSQVPLPRTESATAEG
jgi:hypothetical protein